MRWSASLLKQMPKGETTDVLGYWVPPESSKRVTGSDTITSGQQCNLTSLVITWPAS